MRNKILLSGHAWVKTKILFIDFIQLYNTTHKDSNCQDTDTKHMQIIILLVHDNFIAEFALYLLGTRITKKLTAYVLKCQTDTL